MMYPQNMILTSSRKNEPSDGILWLMYKRNPNIHILRACYESADSAYYENKVNGIMQPLTSSNVKFIPGLDMAPIDFYTVRERAVIEMHQKGFMNVRIRSYDGESTIETWFPTVLEWSELNLKSDVRQTWKRYMVTDFLVYCQGWYNNGSSKSKALVRITKSRTLANVPDTK
jgi:hypothetical protein